MHCKLPGKELCLHGQQRAAAGLGGGAGVFWQTWRREEGDVGNRQKDSKPQRKEGQRDFECLSPSPLSLHPYSEPFRQAVRCTTLLYQVPLWEHSRMLLIHTTENLTLRMP